tara:strand:+ start:1487 stop:1693 length:207 start_codon:yes stop_codon:yes gene_type:complete
MQRTDGPSIDEISSARNQAYRQEMKEIAGEPEPSDDECEWDIITVDEIQYIVSGDRRYKLQDLVPKKD